MNNLQIFNFENKEVRTAQKNNEIWFAGKDVAEVLGYVNPSKALADHVDEEDKLNNESLSSLGQRGGWLINESGLYSLVLSSKLPNAKKFKKWVTSEVLPSIRKHGAYMTDETILKALQEPKHLAKLLLTLADEREQRKALEEQAEIDKPKALFADAVSASDSTILVGDLAKILKQNGFDIGQNKLFERLRMDGFLIKGNRADYNSPTQRAMELGLFKVKETAITHADGHVTISKTTKVTGKGQQYFINYFLKAV
jgi:Prophage antirepressor